MCNFAGWVGTMTQYRLELWLNKLKPEINGDATGIFLHQPKIYGFFKSPGPASSIMQKPAFKNWVNERLPYSDGGFIHLRLATHGSALNNENNHPHISLNDSVLVHKGIVNPKVLFEISSECDSAQILASIDSLGLEKGIANCPGMASIAYMNSFDQDKFYLYTTGYMYIREKPGNEVFWATVYFKNCKRLPTQEWIEIDIINKRVIWKPGQKEKIKKNYETTPNLWWKNYLESLKSISQSSWTRQDSVLPYTRNVTTTEEEDW